MSDLFAADPSKPAPSAKAKRRPRIATWQTPDAAGLWKARADGGKVAGHWIYHDLAGDVYAAVFRIEIKTSEGVNKTYLPLWRDSASGKWGIGDPPGWLPYRADTLADAPAVWAFEGERCADLAAGLGLTATTTAHGAQSPHKTDLAALAAKTVFLVPDHDQSGETYVQTVARLLAGLDPKPTVRIVRLPGLVNPGDDLAEWLQTRTGVDPSAIVAELEALADAAPIIDLAQLSTGSNGTAEPSRNGDGHDTTRPHEAADDPHRLARLFLDSRYTHRDGLSLRFWQGQSHRWDGSYQPVADAELNAEIADAAKAELDRVNIWEIAQWDARGKRDELTGRACKKPAVRKVSNSLIANVVTALSGYSLIPDRTVQPSWLDGAPAPFPADEALPTRNALVHLPGLVAGSADAIHPPTPRFFAPYALDYDFDPIAPEPVTWFRFLESLWPNDYETIGALQQWFGHQLTPDTSHQKVGMFIGPKRSGKGTIARIMTAMVGRANVANPTLASLGANFGLAPLIGKPTAIITDARLSGRSDIAQIVERLLSISGEDGQTIDRKHKPSWTGRLPTRFSIISNELPRLADTSGALAGRMIVFSLTESFYGREDRLLESKLLPELPGILLWAIDGWKMLRGAGRFEQPNSGKPLVEELEELSSPVGTFVKEHCEINPDRAIRVPQLFQAWVEWCKANGRDRPGDTASFSRNLRAVVPSLKTKVEREGTGYVRSFWGIDTKTAF